MYRMLEWISTHRGKEWENVNVIHPSKGPHSFLLGNDKSIRYSAIVPITKANLSPIGFVVPDSNPLLHLARATLDLQ